MAIAADLKERIRQASDLIAVAGSYFDLRPQGRVIKALCPWHPDSNPSLQFNPERQTYKCWVCGEGGDVFSMVMKLEQVNFVQALKLLAERAGIPWPEEAGLRGGPDPEDKALWYRAMAWATEQFQKCLQNAEEAATARQYLAARGISPESVTKFRLGYAPERRNWLQSLAAKTPFSQTVLEKIGLLALGEHGGYYERFRGRVLFPIADLQGRPVALGGRILPDGPPNLAKYINSPETPLFSKSQLLYGLDLARMAIQRSRVALVMEGYTDVVIAHQCEVPQAVAVLGTALTEKHIPLLRRFADRVVLVLDGDDAGKRRANDLLQLFISEQFDLRVLTLPEALDPCDFLLSRGTAAFNELVERAPDALEHKVHQVLAAVPDRNDTHAVTKAVEEVLQLLARMPRMSDTQQRLREKSILNRLAQTFLLPEETIRQRVTELRRPAAPKRGVVLKAEPNRAAPRAENIETELIGLLLADPQCFARMRTRIEPTQLQDPQLRLIYTLADSLVTAGLAPSLEHLLLECDETELKSLLVDLDERARHPSLPPAVLRLERLLECWSNREREERARRDLQRMRHHDLDEESQLALLRQRVQERTIQPEQRN